MTKIAIIGHGFVGRAIAESMNEYIKVLIVDPAQTDLTVQQLPDDVLAIFVCVPTPVGQGGAVDSSIAQSVVREIVERYGPSGSPLVVVKSTLTPEVLTRMSLWYERFVFNPEFLTERNAVRDFIYSKFHVIGANDPSLAIELRNLYAEHSRVSVVGVPLHVVSISSASLIKYAINSFLAAKVAFFNELFDLVKSTQDASWDHVRDAVAGEPRIGQSHTFVPGPDGKRGFGLSCFPKDTAAIVAYGSTVGAPMSIVKSVIESNSRIRSRYELDEREAINNIDFQVDSHGNRFYEDKYGNTVYPDMKEMMGA